MIEARWKSDKKKNFLPETDQAGHMAWGAAKSGGVEPWVQRLRAQDPAFKSLAILRFSFKLA